jgi:ubiquinone/menaquinone biosynthesis C-methylase UbiE/ADP-ribose pyrophosphatase YjhB (NUDIX family)
MAELMSAVLFEKNERALVAHRRRAPFAGQWTLPVTAVRDDEGAEDAMRRHAQEQFGLALEPEAEEFVETLYLTDAADDRQYVANIFRAALPPGPLRFNAEGDYDDARWLGAGDLYHVPMPPDLRIPLIKILSEPESLHHLDWDQMGKELTAQAVPLAEQESTATEEPAPREGPAPDNRAGWDVIAAAYQKERYGDRFGEKLMWSWRASEDDLQVLGDVKGKRALVLGCGGGQDVVALVKLGAIAVGVDSSPTQLAYARKFAQGRDADNASFAEGCVEDLSRFDDASFDLAVSIHVLDYVERVGDALVEAFRVVKSGGALAIAIKHPFGAHVDGPPPLHMWNSYWTAQADWSWEFKDGTSVPLRHYFRTMEQWIAMLGEAGFEIDAIFEPQEAELPKGEGDELDDDWMRLLPYTMVIKARKR